MPFGGSYSALWISTDILWSNTLLKTSEKWFFARQTIKPLVVTASLVNFTRCYSLVWGLICLRSTKKLFILVLYVTLLIKEIPNSYLKLGTLKTFVFGDPLHSLMFLTKSLLRPWIWRPNTFSLRLCDLSKQGLSNLDSFWIILLLYGRVWSGLVAPNRMQSFSRLTLLRPMIELSDHLFLLCFRLLALVPI